MNRDQIDTSRYLIPSYPGESIAYIQFCISGNLVSIMATIVRHIYCLYSPNKCDVMTILSCWALFLAFLANINFVNCICEAFISYLEVKRLERNRSASSFLNSFNFFFQSVLNLRTVVKNARQKQRKDCKKNSKWSVLRNLFYVKSISNDNPDFFAIFDAFGNFQGFLSNYLFFSFFTENLQCFLAFGTNI